MASRGHENDLANAGSDHADGSTVADAEAPYSILNALLDDVPDAVRYEPPTKRLRLTKPRAVPHRGWRLALKDRQKEVLAIEAGESEEETGLDSNKVVEFPTSRVTESLEALPTDRAAHSFGPVVPNSLSDTLKKELSDELESSYEESSPPPSWPSEAKDPDLEESADEKEEVTPRPNEDAYSKSEELPLTKEEDNLRLRDVVVSRKRPKQGFPIGRKLRTRPSHDPINKAIKIFESLGKAGNQDETRISEDLENADQIQSDKPLETSKLADPEEVKSKLIDEVPLLEETDSSSVVEDEAVVPTVPEEVSWDQEKAVPDIISPWVQTGAEIVDSNRTDEVGNPWAANASASSSVSSSSALEGSIEDKLRALADIIAQTTPGTKADHPEPPQPQALSSEKRVTSSADSSSMIEKEAAAAVPQPEEAPSSPFSKVDEGKEQEIPNKSPASVTEMPVFKPATARFSKVASSPTVASPFSIVQEGGSPLKQPKESPFASPFSRMAKQAPPASGSPKIPAGHAPVSKPKPTPMTDGTLPPPAYSFATIGYPSNLEGGGSLPPASSTPFASGTVPASAVSTLPESDVPTLDPLTPQEKKVRYLTFALTGICVLCLLVYIYQIFNTFNKTDLRISPRFLQMRRRSFRKGPSHLLPSRKRTTRHHPQPMQIQRMAWCHSGLMWEILSIP